MADDTQRYCPDCKSEKDPKYDRSAPAAPYASRTARCPDCGMNLGWEFVKK